MDIALTHEPTRLIAQHRRIVATSDLTSFYDSAYSAVISTLAAAGITPTGPAIGWYAGMPDGKADVAAAFPVARQTVGPLADDVDVVELDGGRAITAEYQGAYEGLPDAWAALESWRAAAALVARGDFWEEYLTDPIPGGDARLNRTRLVLPVL